MQLIPLVIGSLTTLGFGYFCLDFYRNRRRLLTKPTTDMVVYDVLPCDSADMSHAEHAVSGAECVSGGVGHCVDAISHTFFHH